MKTFAFVNLSVDSGYYGVNHGIAYLVPVVRRHSFEVALLNIVDEISAEDFRRRIERLSPAVVAFSCTSLQVKYLKKYSEAIEKCPDTLLVAGGVGPTLEPERILLETSVDGVAIGEGETPLDLLLQTIKEGGDHFRTRGFYWKRDGTIEKTEIPPFISDLSQLDHPDYSVFEKNVVQPASSLNVIISRGCPHSCNYCSNKATRSAYPSAKGYFRVPPVEHAMGLLGDLVRQYPGTAYIDFEDDLLIARKQWFLSFASEYRRRIGLPYRVAVRTECLDEDIVEALKGSGCDVVFMGLESGNETFRKKVLNRHHSNEEMVEKAKMIKRAGIKLFTFNVFGFPFETEKNLQETVKLNKRIESDCGACSFFYPLPGTELHRMCKKHNLLKSEEAGGVPSNFNERPVIRMTPAHEKKVIRAQKQLLSYFYWQDLKYEHGRFCSTHSWPRAAVNLVRLVGPYLLKKVSSPYKKNSLYRRVMDSKLRLALWRLLFRRAHRPGSRN